MEVQIAVSKINKHNTDESGDTLEYVERPNGGISVVMADAQIEGHLAKTVSASVVRKVISLLAEGVRDGAAARAASDYLYTERNGHVAAYLNIISVDLQTCTIVISRNNPVPIYVAFGEKIEVLSGESMPIGTSRNIRPAISEISLEPGMTVMTFTNGLLNAGMNFGQQIEICTFLESLLEEQEPEAQYIADTILYEAIRVDNNKPQYDMSLVILRVLPHETDHIRRMSIKLPFNNSPYTTHP
jgi:serine phosphatase RsbU (regulator of sigma subunit)